MHDDLCHTLENCSRQFLLALDGPECIWFLVQPVLVHFKEGSIEIGDPLLQVIQEVIIFVNRELCQLQPCLQILAMKLCVVLVAIVILISVDNGDGPGSVHELNIPIDAWRRQTVVKAYYWIIQIIICQFLIQ